MLSDFVFEDKFCDLALDSNIVQRCSNNFVSLFTGTGRITIIIREVGTF
jgi:hypothetical protein